MLPAFRKCRPCLRPPPVLLRLIQRSSMSILSIGAIKFAQEEYESSKFENVTFPSADRSTREHFLDGIKKGEFDHVIALNRHLHDKTIGRLDEEIIQNLPKSVKVIGNIGAGYDQIDVAAATKRSIYVTNTPDAVRDATADTALFLLLSVLRNFGEGIKALEAGKWLDVCDPGRCPSSRKIGILGMGSIGRAFALRCLSLGCELQYHNRSESADAPNDVTYVSFDKLLSTSDVIFVSVPLNASTRHLLSSKEFEKMKRGSYLINTARGPIIDEAAMVKALDDGILKAVGLDVYENEPEVHEELRGRKGCVLLPHMGTNTTDASKLMEVSSLENITSVVGGGRRNIVPEQRDCHF